MLKSRKRIGEGPIVFTDRPRRRSLDMAELGIPEFVRVSYVRTQCKVFQPEEHVHTGLWEIVFIRHGRATYVIDGKERIVSSGDVIVNPPGVPHCIRDFPSGLESYAMMFAWPRGRKPCLGATPEAVGLIGRGLKAVSSPAQANSQRLTFLFRMFFETRDALTGAVRAERLRTVLLLILQEVVLMPHTAAAACVVSEPSRSARINALVAEMRRAPQCEYQLGKAAERVYLSVQQFTHQFRQMTGYTFHQYLLKCRVEAARPRLRRGESLSAVARATGFSSAQLLAGAFRRIVGKTVGKWREDGFQ